MIPCHTHLKFSLISPLEMPNNDTSQAFSTKNIVRFIFVQVFIILGSLFLVSSLIGLIGYDNPAIPLPEAYDIAKYVFPHFSARELATSQSFFVQKWPYVLFFTLVIFGEVSIFRLRKKIFLKNQRKK